MPRPLLSSIQSPSLDRAMRAVREGKLPLLTGLPEGLAAFLAARITGDTGWRVLCVCGSDLRAARALEDAQPLLTQRAAALPGGDIDLTRGASSQEGAWQRLETLTSLCQGETRLLFASAEALAQRMGSPARFRSGIFRLRPGDRVAPQEIMRRLTRLGYERVDLVEGKGQAALRGDVLDVYPPSAIHALRIELFDDEVDSVRAFDCINQRSLERLDGALIAPCAEVLLEESGAETAAARMHAALAPLRREGGAMDRLMAALPALPEDEEETEEAAPAAPAARRDAERRAEVARRLDALERDVESVREGLPFRRVRAWLPVLTDETATLLDWFEPQLIILSEPDALRERCRERQRGFEEDLREAMERGEAVAEQAGLLLPWEETARRLQAYPLMLFSDLTRGLAAFQPDEVIGLDAAGLNSYSAQLRSLADDLRLWKERGWTAVLLSGSAARGQRLSQNLADLGTPVPFREEALTEPGEAVILPLSLSHGFVWPEAGLAVAAPGEIWGSQYRRGKARRNAGERISAFTELKPGDYVVHEDHGVGIFQGTVRQEFDGAMRDYLLIQYAGSDRLYVPVEQLQRIQRYIGNPNQTPKLSRFGSTEWQRQKGKVKEGLRKLAFDLVALYAARSEEKGHAFSPDTPWQKEFEDLFPYELTRDQEQSVREITADMESRRAMDRLLVGDVGYGKTEVALRAAFKAVQDSKQVAFLAPTTILAQQHFTTAQRRFASFPVTVEVLSRFKTAREQKDILRRVKEGRVDILVGTHRMLSKDVQFRDLGLLIVDEEQRFGVGAKETIKNLKQTVDVLTLSATPIPRTLHMSLSGIRDMSVLESPPEDRLPVRTHVVEYSDALIRDAILREIGRGGQVYFLYNRVGTIERFHERLRQLVPEARIGIAHGQMHEKALEDVMMDFYGGSYDVLLCTTIIESGLDVPTANTLIVNDSDMFGLSQLYQLRGRVGRSSRQAYAYFTFRSDKILSETAEQRLSAIREFTEFGAGFRIALRDLEIRGAGNVLGPEQHGHLAAVGYEMYCRLVEEALNEVRGRPDRSELETRVDLAITAFLPESYIADEKQRMEMYRRIAEVATEADRADVLDEMIDRFGEPPHEAELLLDIARLRALSSHVGASRVFRRPGQLSFKLEQRFVPEPALLLSAMAKADSRFALTPSATPLLILRGSWPSDEAALPDAVRAMGRLCEELDLAAAAAPDAQRRPEDV